MHKIEPRIYCGKYFVLGSQYRFEIFEGSGEKYDPKAPHGRRDMMDSEVAGEENNAIIYNIITLKTKQYLFSLGFSYLCIVSGV